MKKLISLLLMVCMVALLVPAMAEGVVGTWYAVSMSEGEMTISPADMGMSVTMTLNEDGTAMLESSGMDEPQTGSWTQDGDKVIIVDANGEEEEAILADGTLTLTEGEMIMVFSQEEPQNSAAAAEAVLADSEDAFYGTWIVDKIEIEGTFYSLSMLENIENTGGDEAFSQDGESVIWQADGKDIVYQGTSDKAPAVVPRVTVTVDGKEADASALSSLTGDVTLTVSCEAQETSGIKRRGR